MNVPDWHALGSSVRGDSHRRNGLPNQDAIAIIPGDEGPVVVAIADGHGSPRSFRSDVGSALAVRIATRAVRAFVTRLEPTPQVRDLERLTRSRLVPEIVARWTEAVRADLSERPFADAEFTQLRERGDSSDPSEDPLIAYGATLVMAALRGPVLLLAQIGDGDVLTVSQQAKGPVTSRPVPRDPRLVNNETTSLCLPDAVGDFRVRALDLRSADSPSLVLLSTDGYANSFVSEAAFLQAGPDILRGVEDHGLGWVGEQLSGWLEDASKHGSGDDITMGLLVKRSQAESSGVPPAVDTERRPTPDRQGRPTPVSVIAVGVALVVGLVVGGLAFGGGGNDRPANRSRSAPSHTVSATPGWTYAGGSLIEFEAGKEPRFVEVPALSGKSPTDVASGLNWVWVATAEGTLLRVDPSTGRSMEKRLDGQLSGVAIEGRNVFVANADGSLIYVVDPMTLKVTDRISEPSQLPPSSEPTTSTP